MSSPCEFNFDGVCTRSVKKHQMYCKSCWCLADDYQRENIKSLDAQRGWRYCRTFTCWGNPKEGHLTCGQCKNGETAHLHYQDEEDRPSQSAAPYQAESWALSVPGPPPYPPVEPSAASVAAQGSVGGFQSGSMGSDDGGPYSTEVIGNLPHAVLFSLMHTVSLEACRRFGSSYQ